MNSLDEKIIILLYPFPPDDVTEEWVMIGMQAYTGNGLFHRKKTLVLWLSAFHFERMMPNLN